MFSTSGEQAGTRRVRQPMSVCLGGRELGSVDRRQEPEDRQALPDRRRREDQLRKGPQGCQLGPGAGRRPPSGATIVSIVIFKLKDMSHSAKLKRLFDKVVH